MASVIAQFYCYLSIKIACTYKKVIKTASFAVAYRENRQYCNIDEFRVNTL